MTMSTNRLLSTAFLLAVLACGLVAGVGLPLPVHAEDAADLYYQVPGTPQGPAAPSPTDTVYSRIGSFDSRLLVWFVTQQHTYFGGFVLALPLFCALLEFLGLLTNKPALSLRYDGLARDLAKVALLALSVTAVVGGLMLGMFLWLYPSFMKYMGGTFKAFMPAYAIVFVGESLLLILYYYSWNRMAEPGLKWIHAAIGILTNIFGTALLLLANSWAAFMMSPAGVDAQGRFLGNGWHLLHSALWNPLNVHRFLADIMSGGAVVLAYACYRFFTSKTDGERAYFDWVGYIFLFVTVCALLPMPIAGYWLMRSVYAFRQSMGVTMMGGLLTWLFVVQALLIGALLLGINYYIWQSMARIKGGERYQSYYQVLVGALTLALFIWLTPHTVLMSPGELKAMGGAQHPVVGNYGVMSAKNGAVNVMILLTALSYLYLRRANRTMTVSWVKTGNILIGTLFAVGLINVIWLSVYGFYLPAKLRVGLSTPQAVTTLTIIVASLLINRAMLKGSLVHGPVQWGKISVRGMVVLFALAGAFTWVMGLMGYIRSSGRLSWHVNEVMADVSPWAFTPELGFAAKMVTLNMVVFWSAVLAPVLDVPTGTAAGAGRRIVRYAFADVRTGSLARGVKHQKGIVEDMSRIGNVVMAAGLVALLALPSGSLSAQGQQLVLEDFQAKEADGFPASWDHESQRSHSKGREAYKVQSENGTHFLSAKDAGQRIKKKKIDWDPKAYPVLTWRWRLNKASEGTEPLAAVYASLDTDLMFIPVFTKYIWSATKPEGTVIEGGMFSGSEIVVQSGTTQVGQWVEEKVNAYEDFKRIHQHEPAAKAWGISIIAGPGVEIDFGPMVATSEK